MSAVIRIRKNLLGEHSPETIKKELCDLLQDSYFNKINSRPVYQRHIRWAAAAMNDFIATVMNNGLVLGLIMYQLATDEKNGKNEGKSLEMVDGQHRLFTLRAFMDASIKMVPHIKKPFIVHWNYETLLEDGTAEYSHVFYKKTDDVVKWCRENNITPQYLTEEERDHFDHFGINLTLMKGRLSLDQRREIFMSLQKGIPVRNSDFLKNKTDCELVAFVSENNYEGMMADTFFEHCHKKAANYWVHWICRCFLLYKHFNAKFHSNKYNDVPASEIFLIEDKQITKDIKNNSPELNPKDGELIHAFDNVFRDFIEFLQRLDAGQKLNPTQIFALFYSFCDESKNFDIILTHVPNIAKEGNKKDKKTMWESKAEKAPRREYFNYCLNQINSIAERAHPLDDRQISKALKKLVWAKCVDNQCAICEDLITKKAFEAGHITARTLGGQIDIDNLIPICFGCNRGMGTRNAWEYKRDMYPEHEFAGQEN
jgi:hypothetical protein